MSTPRPPVSTTRRSPSTIRSSPSSRARRGWPTPAPGWSAAYADVLDGAFDAKLALGGGRELVGDLEAAVAAHPFRERLHGHLALALYRAGRQTDALRSLADARRALAEEIGVEPGPDLRRLEADILAQAPHLDAANPRPSRDRATAPTSMATIDLRTVGDDAAGIPTDRAGRRLDAGRPRQRDRSV